MVSAFTNEGYSLDHWLLNGSYLTGPENPVNLDYSNMNIKPIFIKTFKKKTVAIVKPIKFTYKQHSNQTQEPGFFFVNHKNVFFSPSLKLTLGFQPVRASSLLMFGRRRLGSSLGNG